MTLILRVDYKQLKESVHSQKSFFEMTVFLELDWDLSPNQIILRVFAAQLE